MGGTAFTSMVTGVLFLVPVSFFWRIYVDLLNGFSSLVLVKQVALPPMEMALTLEAL